MSRPRRSVRPVAIAGLVIGIGMGGFLDGILLHQVFQFHNMMSARVPTDDLVGAKVNMVWDGLFHAGVWVATAIGILLLFRAARHPDALLSGKALGAGALLGWGLFNLVEGTVDHHLLGLHHVYEPAGLSRWDYLFLAFGAAQGATGWMIVRTAAHDASLHRPHIG